MARREKGQFPVSLRDQHGDVILARQVSTQPDEILDFFDQLTRCCAQPKEPFIASSFIDIKGRQ